MAGNLGNRTADKPYLEKVRERIKSTLLVERLQDHILGHQEMSQTQIKAAEILLRKTIPDLKAVETTLQGEGGGPVRFIVSDQTAAKL